MQSCVKKQLTQQYFENLDRVLTGSRESLDVGCWAGEVAEPLGDGEAAGGRGGFWWMLLLLLGGELGFPAGVCHSSSGERGLPFFVCFSLPNLWYKAFYNIYYSFDKSDLMQNLCGRSGFRCLCSTLASATPSLATLAPEH